ncbi:MAG: transglycosylase domain-containing protein [Nocardioides sp.]
MRAPEDRPGERPGDRPAPWGVLGRLVAVVAVSAVIGVLAAGLVLPFAGVAGVATRAAAQGAHALPEEMQFEPLPQRSVLLDRHGKVLATFFDQNRVTIPLSRVAPVMRQAIIAIEDHRFYEHGALDLKGTLRALVSNSTGDEVQGGSSITQQMVKMTLLNQAKTPEEQAAATEKSYRRKVDELRFAIRVEEEHTKDWILQRYLNTAYYGDGAYGIEVAARHYFSRPAAELRLHQAALLAGLVNNPTAYDPTRHPRAAERRRDTVLTRMQQLGVISAARAERARERGLGLRLTQTPNGCVSTTAAWFCDYARAWLMRDKTLGDDPEQRRTLLRTGGLTVQTTLAPGMQRAADKSVRRHVDPTDRAIGGLALVEPGTGDVRALAQSRPMGGRSRQGQTYLNYVVPERYGDAGGFQAGSTFKVFVLAAALRQGMDMHTEIKAPPQIAVPIERYRGCHGPLDSDKVWDPANSTSSGRFDLYSGTQLSVNTFFAKLELRTGLCTPYRLAKEMGVRLEDPDNEQVPAFTLGVVGTDPLTMAGAYATFAARGRHCEPRPVTRITTSSGKTLAEVPTDCRRVLPRGVADAVNDVLRGVQEPGGFGHSAGIALRQPSAGKTGTIDGHRAVWFVGYTPDLAGAAMIAGANRQGHWVSLNGQVVGGRRISEAHGSTTAGPVWGDAMQAIQRWLPDRDFHRPGKRVVQGDTVTVPDVVGMPFDRAARVLQRAGLLIRVDGAQSRPDEDGVVDLQPVGVVRKLRPKAGREVPSGSELVARLRG